MSAPDILFRAQESRFGATMKSILQTVFVLIAAITVVSPRTASASVFKLDNFSVNLNGSLVFDDAFSDGTPPSSAPDFISGGPASYFTFGNFSTETGGKLTLQIGDSVDSMTPAGAAAKVQNARLLTPSNPANSLTLGSDDTFVVSGLFDLILPGLRGERYRIGLSDRTGPQGPGDTTSDNLRLAVERKEGGVFDGQVVVTFRDLDFVTDTSSLLGIQAIDLTGDPDQIRLTLAKTVAGLNEITASFTYLKNGGDLSSATTFANTASIFEGESFTRAEFDALFVPEPTTLALLGLGLAGIGYSRKRKSERTEH